MGVGEAGVHGVQGVAGWQGGLGNCGVGGFEKGGMGGSTPRHTQSCMDMEGSRLVGLEGCWG